MYRGLQWLKQELGGQTTWIRVLVLSITDCAALKLFFAKVSSLAKRGFLKD